MIDIKFIRENPGIVKSACKNKREPDIVDALLLLDEKRRALQKNADEIRHKQKEISASVAIAFREKDFDRAESLKNQAKSLSDKIKEIEEKERKFLAEWEDLLLRIPNIPLPDVPIGDERANKIIKEWGEIPRLDFDVRDHIELGSILGILDMERGAKVAGSAFPMLIGDGARMSRALIAMMLDIHREAGFKEIAPPYLANRSAMLGSAQIPKLEGDMYHLQDEDLFLIPTSEVPVTNFHAGEILDEESLPLYYTAYSANFRKEAGSYGAETRGLLRVHQFDKVELVKFTHPERSLEEHETLLIEAEKILQALELPYRVNLLATGDMSFASCKVYDLELWAPAEKKWLEVSSCSNFLDFQARRSNIRYRPKDGGPPKFLHTLNASGVALPRLLVALWENYQTDRGTIKIPDRLRPYMNGQDEIISNI